MQRHRTSIALARNVEAAVEELPPKHRREVLSGLATEMAAGVGLPAAMTALLTDPETRKLTKAVLCWLAARLSVRAAGPAVLAAFVGARRSELAWVAAKAAGALRPGGAVATFAAILTTARSRHKCLPRRARQEVATT